jgi:hypothetical protein
MSTFNNSDDAPIVGGFDIYLVNDINHVTGNEKDGDRVLNIDFHGGNWKALFFDALGCPIVEWHKGDSYEQFYERARRIFGQALPEYPMLSRICDMYEDALYKSEEVGLLLNECMKIQSLTTNTEALEGLQKLILACNEAAKEGKGLGLISD